MKRKKIVAGNWKMNLDISQAIQLATDIKMSKESFACDVIIFPSYLFIPEVKHIVFGSRIHLGAQNCSLHENGAYTGEVSARQLKGAGVEYVIVGHSERRMLHGETNELVSQKLQLAFKNRLKPVFCCGEPLEVRNAGMQHAYVLKQLEDSIFELPPKDIANITIAYEPIWAIGTGLNATPEQAQEMHAFIRGQLAAIHPIALQTRILYGGSCNKDNAQQLFACPDVDGGLIGGASLNATEFLAIIEAAK